MRPFSLLGIHQNQYISCQNQPIPRRHYSKFGRSQLDQFPAARVCILTALCVRLYKWSEWPSQHNARIENSVRNKKTKTTTTGKKNKKTKPKKQQQKQQQTNEQTERVKKERKDKENS